MNIHRLCIIGGSGFVGHHLCARLSAANYRVRVLTRRRTTQEDLRVLPGVELVATNIHDPEALQQQLAGCDAVINLAGILNEKRRAGRRFEDVHVRLPERLVAACRQHGITRLLHMSALKADAQGGPSRYLRTKGQGEDLVHAAQDLQVTSFRPSVIFGPDDQFFNRFARLLDLTPGIFPLACAEARFAPVFVGDVATAFVHALENPQTYGQRYELCGPRPYTLQQLVEYTARLTQHKTRIIPLGRRLSWLQGLIMEHLPTQPFSRDNYHSTRSNSLCKSAFPEVFHLTPATIEAVVPTYLGPRDRNRRLSQYRLQAGRQTQGQMTE
jgi:NADH dehydrogenase